MAIRYKEKWGKREIDISGPDGNAFVLLGIAESYARQIGYTDEHREGLLEDMKSSDYNHLIKVFDSHFGTIVDLVENDPEDD